MTDTRKARQARRASRELVAGRLVAVAAPEHGKPSTYTNWGCRCQPCTGAWAAYAAARSRATPYPKPRRRAKP